MAPQHWVVSSINTLANTLTLPAPSAWACPPGRGLQPARAGTPGAAGFAPNDASRNDQQPQKPPRPRQLAFRGPTGHAADATRRRNPDRKRGND
jgi:hypothetical protein